MKNFMNEFKAFALQGNVMSLAIGVIIGAAFQDIVTSLTDNILSPLIGLLIGQNFDTLSLDVLGVTLYYGAFITSVVNFTILAFVVFLLVKSINKVFTRKEEETTAEPERTCLFCMSTVHQEATRCGSCTSTL